MKHTQQLWVVIGGLMYFVVTCAQAGAGGEKAYIAVEGDGKIAVLDTATRQINKEIDLGVDSGGMPVEFAPHNVQVAPDGGSVWVTANVHGGHDPHGGGEHGAMAATADQVIVIDPRTDSIIRRIPVASGAHLAHVVLSADSRSAYVNAQEQQRIYRIDTASYKVSGYTTVAGQGPHGLRLAADGGKLYVAMLEGKSLGVMDIGNNAMDYVPVSGAAVQIAVTPDGKYALASVYDSKSIAAYDIAQQRLSHIALPAAAQGPVQLYPTPDSRYVYVADQGYYFGKPQGDKVYKIDMDKRQVVATIKAGAAPHGIVVAKDGRWVYVTNLLGGDISIIDGQTDQETARVPVGKEPNGISLWSEKLGGTP